MLKTALPKHYGMKSPISLINADVCRDTSVPSKDPYDGLSESAFACK